MEFRHLQFLVYIGDYQVNKINKMTVTSSCQNPIDLATIEIPCENVEVDAIVKDLPVKIYMGYYDTGIWLVFSGLVKDVSWGRSIVIRCKDLMEVLRSAFTPTAAAGGFAGASVMLAMRSGVARGVFSNESGLGSAPIVAAAAKTKWPAEQGLVSMTGTFIDTIIICTLTGLTLVVSGLWKGDLNGAALTQAAFMQGYPEAGKIVLMVGLVLFAFTTILGWNYYGERCIVYLAGVKAILPYRIIFIVLVALGAFLKLEAIWVLADIVNGLMAIPNLIALLALSGVVVAETC